MFSDKNTPPEFRPANSTGTGGSPYIPYSKENTKSPVLRLLNYSLVLNVIGFGSCWTVLVSSGFEGFSQNFFMIIPAIIYIFAGFLALRSSMLARKAFDAWWKTTLAWILALALGGWGFFWGVYGLFLIFGF